MRFYENLEQSLSEIKRDIIEMGLKVNGTTHMLGYSFKVNEMGDYDHSKYNLTAIDRFIGRKGELLSKFTDKINGDGFYKIPTMNIHCLINEKSLTGVIQISEVNYEDLGNILLTDTQIIRSILSKINLDPSVVRPYELSGIIMQIGDLKMDNND